MDSRIVLIVDDDPAYRAVVKRLCESAGHRVLTAGNGEEALTVVRQERPHVVLSDVLMPVMNGFELIRRLQTDPSTASIPVMLMSGVVGGAEAKVLAASNGAARILMKPFTGDELRAALREAMQSPPSQTPPRPELEVRQGQVLAERLIQAVTAAEASEAALRASERTMRAIFDQCPSAILLADDAMRYLDANPAATTLTGYSRDELLRMRAPDLIPSGEILGMEELWREFRQRGTLAGEIRLMCKEGRIRHVDFRAVAEILPEVHMSFLRDITDHVQAEQALREGEKRLQVLTHRLMETQETERRELARELHDEVGQTLTALKINLEAARQQAPPELVESLRDSVELIDPLLDQVRSMSLHLRPPLLDTLGLVAALRWHLRQQAARGNLRVHFSSDPPSLEVAPRIATACFRIAQEAMTNILRHAGATMVTLELWIGNEELHLMIRDDGKGFDLEAREHEHEERMGLLGMRERAALLGGRLEIHSRPGSGTEILTHLPADNVH